MSKLHDFFSHTPTDSEVWRAIVAFGRNTATYKFAFGKTLLEMASNGITEATTEDLARPFATALCTHLKHSEKQITRDVKPGSFLATCKEFNQGDVDEAHLLAITAKKGFINVIEAFQRLSGLDESRFYSGDFRKGITFHDELLKLARSDQATNLEEELEARWRLVESAWNLQLNPALIQVQMDRESNVLFLRDALTQRFDLASARPALNAYQKGTCFYCTRRISVAPDGISGSHVDHFHPFHLAQHGFGNVNGVWNLVLACGPCNLSKSGTLPHESLPERLVRRNNWYCHSKHPLSETIQSQTGKSAQARLKFIQSRYKMASVILGLDTSRGWQPNRTD